MIRLFKYQTFFAIYATKLRSTIKRLLLLLENVFKYNFVIIFKKCLIKQNQEMNPQIQMPATQFIEDKTKI